VYRCPAPACVSPMLPFSCSVEQWLLAMVELLVDAVVEGAEGDVVVVTFDDDALSEPELHATTPARKTVETKNLTAKALMLRGYGRSLRSAGMDVQRMGRN